MNPQKIKYIADSQHKFKYGDPCDPIIINNFSLTQTGAMSRYCGKLSGLYPKNDDLLAAKIDQIIDICTDMTVLFSNYRKNIETKIIHNKRKEFFDNIKINFNTMPRSIFTAFP